MKFGKNLLKFFFVFIGIQFFSIYLETAQAEDKGLMVTLVSEDAPKHVLIPQERIDDWNSNIDLVDTSWTECVGLPGGIGFDQEKEYSKFITLDLESNMFRRQTSCYIRAKFDLSSSVLNEIDYLVLQVQYDDGFVAYINGEQVMQANAPLNIGWRSAASQPHEAQSMLTFDISQHIDKLQNGENLLAIQGLNVTGDSPDFLILPRLMARKNYKNNFYADLPIVIINTVENQTIGTDDKSQAELGIIFNTNGATNKLTDVSNDFFGPVEIMNIPNEYGYSKSHFEFSIVNDVGQVADASLLDMPEGNEWLLYAPYSDKTLMRNALMLQIGHKMGMGTHPGRFVHLFIDDDYFGIYLLVEKRNQHANRVHISQITPVDNSGDPLTGGYMLKLDNRRWMDGFISEFLPFRTAELGIKYLYYYPDSETITQSQKDYIRNFLNEFESAANIDKDETYLNYLDEASFINYYLVSEVAKNVNAYRNHTIFYKDRDSINPRLFIEPVWDFDTACGNVNFYQGSDFTNWQLDFLMNEVNVESDSMFVPFWWGKLISDVQFTKNLYKRWMTLRSDVLSEDSITQILDSLYTHLENDRVLNFERWPVLGKSIEPNMYVGSSFDDEYAHLLIWMIDRLEWMDIGMEDFQTGITNREIFLKNFSLMQNYPNPFNPQTTIGYVLPASGQVELSVCNIQGQRIDVLINQKQDAGFYRVQWNGSIYPSGLYFYELRVNNHIARKSMLLLK